MLQFTKETDYGIQLLLALAKLKDRQVLSLRKFSAANRKRRWKRLMGNARYQTVCVRSRTVVVSKKIIAA
ncbi:MAG: hypothetical protein HZC26_01350 [Candidatus Magasanikbacteria bacterium]|nr:hypothetical protein [Candidatus Magasanikbacteria bacterium]